MKTILDILFLTIRFLIFITGIISGFMFALFVFPLPGKTFFNKMSKLPNSTKNLIDDSISLATAFFRLMFTSYKEGSQRLKETAATIENKLHELKEKYHLDSPETSKTEVENDIIKKETIA